MSSCGVEKSQAPACAELLFCVCVLGIQTAWEHPRWPGGVTKARQVPAEQPCLTQGKNPPKGWICTRAEENEKLSGNFQ